MPRGARRWSWGGWWAERDRVLDAFRAAESVQGLGARLRRRDGAPTAVQVSGRALRGKDGGIEGFAILVIPDPG